MDIPLPVAALTAQAVLTGTITPPAAGASPTDPGTPSLAYQAMAPSWQVLRDVMAGTPRLADKSADTYLPKFPVEEQADYDFRKKVSFVSNHFEDAVRGVAGQPFGKMVKFEVNEETPKYMYDWERDIDCQGSSLHGFAQKVFGEGVLMSMAFILADHVVVPEGATLADELKINARPYLRCIRADDMLSFRCEVAGGKIVVTEARWREFYVRKVGFAEYLTPRIRIMRPGEYETWEYDQNGWGKKESGVLRRARRPGETESSILEYVPIVPFVCNMTQADSIYVTKPPFLDLAYKQIEHFQVSSGLRAIMDGACFPMLVLIGVSPPLGQDGKPEKVTVGPKTVIFAGSDVHASQSVDIKYCEPSADSINAIQLRIDHIENEMRLLALQPTLPQKGAQQATATASTATQSKQHSTVQTWALGLQDALELACQMMCDWRGDVCRPGVNVNTDFKVHMRPDLDAKEILAWRAAGVISRETLWEEGQRRDVLGPNFDPIEEKKRLEKEGISDINGVDLGQPGTAASGAGYPGGADEPKPGDTNATEKTGG